MISGASFFECPLIRRADHIIRLKLTFILGFSATFVNPPMIADVLNSFSMALYCKGMSLEEGIIEVFGGKREFLTKHPVVFMQCDSRTEVSRKECMITLEVYLT